MKKCTPPLFALLALVASSSAADPQSSFGLAPSAPPQLDPASLPSSNSLTPEIPGAPEKSTKAGHHGHTDSTAVAEDKMKKRVTLRQAVAKAERDPQLQALKDEALVATTDFEQRKLYVEYYNRLVDRIAKVNPGMTKDEIEELRAQYVNHYRQDRVAPTIDPAIARAQR